MPLRRNDHVKEDLELLNSLEQLHLDMPLQGRITMLRLLREEPERTLRQVAEMVGRSEPTIQRWWAAYRKGGLNGLLHVGKQGGGRPARIDAELLDTLRELLDDGELRTLDDARNWLKEQCGVEYSRSGVHYLIDSMLKMPRAVRVRGRAGIAAQDPVAAHAVMPIPPHVLRFLNALPVTDKPLEWVNTFRAGLQQLMPEVDRISVNININCNLSAPEMYHPTLHITQHARNEVVSVASRSKDDRPSDKLLDDFRHQGLPLQDYHPPLCFEYYYAGMAYTGTIFLWRELRKAPISQRTIDMLTAMEPFLIFVITSHVARYQNAQPINAVFHDSLESLVQDAHLSDQEKRIVVMQLLGHSYKEIADLLNIALATVKKHLASIHRKTDTHGFTELFAKYFTPRLNVHRTVRSDDN